MGINFNRHKKGEEGRGTLEYSAGVESVVRYMKERLYEFPESPLNENSNYMDGLKRINMVMNWQTGLSVKLPGC